MWAHGHIIPVPAVNCYNVSGKSSNIDSFNHAVPETSIKEVLPCEMSPIGFSLSISVKDKIWKGEFIHILSLLPSSKEFLRLENKSEDK